MVFKKGHKHSQETKDKIRKTSIGRKMSKEVCNNISSRMKINNPMNNPETIEKMRQTRLKRFKDGIDIPCMLGKHHTIEAKRKISVIQKEVWKDKKHSKKEHRKILSARNMAVRRIPLKSSCEICGSIEKLERHHWRYDKPLLVNTLCNECHNIQHPKASQNNNIIGGFRG